MGETEVPIDPSQQIFKTPTSSYEFGANFIDPKVCSFVCFWYYNVLFVSQSTKL